MVPFMHQMESRFSPGTFGVRYAAETLEIAVRESTYHAELIAAKAKMSPRSIPRVAFRMRLRTSRMADIRPGAHDDPMDPAVRPGSRALRDRSTPRQAAPRFGPLVRTLHECSPSTRVMLRDLCTEGRRVRGGQGAQSESDLGRFAHHRDGDQHDVPNQSTSALTMGEDAWTRRAARR